MKIGIVGHGFVGKAVEDALQGFEHEIEIVDPKWSKLTVRYLVTQENPEYIFVCVPTPSNEDGSCNDSEVGNTLSILKDVEYKGIVILKSTVPPDRLNRYQTDYANLNVVYNPEFLQQSTASYDILNPKIQILGGEPALTHQVHEFYEFNTLICDSPTFMVDIATASLAKYAINTFLATKVTFMNMLHEIHANTETDDSFMDLITILANEPRVGKSHLHVPGPDGKYGYGGACFPKDTKAFQHYGARVGVDTSLLHDVEEANKQYRDKESS